MDITVKKNGEKIGVAIVGGSGFGAGELLRLFTYHPEVEVVSVVSHTSGGTPIAELHRGLATHYPTKQTGSLSLGELSKFERAVIFLALPSGVSGEWVKENWAEVTQREIRIIDLSGDYRLKDQTLHESFYPEVEFSQVLRQKFVYGLSELQPVGQTTCITNPGCYATACSLAVAPLVAQGFQGKIFFDAKSGSSGAGKATDTKFMHSVLHGSMFGYKILCHRHEPEISQTLAELALKTTGSSGRVEVLLVPQVIPTARGMSVTAHLTLPSAEKKSSDALQALYREFYQQSAFVRIVNSPPTLGQVVGSNFCDLFVLSRGQDVVVIAVIDNLVKGMAGQAIQNMNLMFGLDETCGLSHPALGIG